MNVNSNEDQRRVEQWPDTLTTFASSSKSSLGYILEPPSLIEVVRLMEGYR